MKSKLFNAGSAVAQTRLRLASAALGDAPVWQPMLLISAEISKAGKISFPRIVKTSYKH